MTPKELRAQHVALLRDARQIIGPPDEPRSLTAEEAARVREILAKAATIKEQLTRLEVERELADQEAAVVPESQFERPVTPAAHAAPLVHGRGDRGLRLARVVRALAAGRGDVGRAAQWARVVARDEAIAKILEAGTGAAGGFLVREELATEVIELLRAESVVRRLNPVTVPMESGTLRLPAITGGATAGYIGESADLSVSEQTFGQVVLTWKKLGTLVPVSNDLLRFASPQADEIVRDDLVAALATTSDAKFIRGAGSQNEPKGLRYWAPAGNVITANSTVDLANVTADLGKLVLALKNANVRMRRPAWIFAPRTEQYLMTVRDANGNFAFRDEMLRGTLWGWPFGVTTNVPTNLGSGGDESEVYLADFADVVIGESSTLTIDASAEAAYVSGGTVKSAFQADLTLVRALALHDFAMRHAESVAVLTGVKWTP
jgi:HK97 family phage major capsid protein